MDRALASMLTALLPPRYRIERVLSDGDRSLTLHVFDTGLHQAPAVLKVESLGDDVVPEVEAGFRRVCAALASLQSDWLAVPYTFGMLVSPSRRLYGYTVRAYVNGAPLSSLPLPMTTEAVLLSTLHVCQGLQALHASNLFHCDLKPENVIVRHAGGGKVDGRSQCVLIDIAYRPQPSTEALTEVTLQYLAPEMLDGHPASPRTDLYAVGVMAYRLLTGRLPFDGATLADMIRRQRAREFPPLAALRQDLPSGLCDVVERLLEPNPENRPESVGALVAFLHEQAGSIATGVRSPSGSRRFVGRGSELSACVKALGLDRTVGASSLEISGLRGCGVTSFLRELQDRLEARGATVLTAAPRALAGTTLQFQLREAVHAIARRPLPSDSEPERLRPPRTSTDLLDDLLVATQDRKVVLFVDDWRFCDVGEIQFVQRLIRQEKAAGEAMPSRSGRCQLVLGSTSDQPEKPAALSGDISKWIRLDGLRPQDVAVLLGCDGSFPRAFSSRLHATTGGVPRAIRAFLDRVPSDRVPREGELEAILAAVTQDREDERRKEVEALRQAPGGYALLALSLWSDELDLPRWRAIAGALGSPSSVELVVDRIEANGSLRVRSCQRHLSEFVVGSLSDSELDRIVRAVLDATRALWRSNEPTELIPLLRFVARLGRVPVRTTWSVCRALILLLDRGYFADVESVAAAISRGLNPPWWVSLFHDAARTSAMLLGGAPSGLTEAPVDAGGFFRAWILARRLLRARYRREALEILDVLWVSSLPVLRFVSLALAEDRALAAAETADAGKLTEVMRWMLNRVRRSTHVTWPRSGGPVRAIRARLRACRQRARFQRVRARAHTLRGRIERALTACRNERLLDRAHGNTLREASCLNNEGILLTRAGAGPASVTALERAVRLREKLDDEGGLAICLINLAAALSASGNIGGAASVLNRARIVATRNGLVRLRNLSLLSLAIAYSRRGQLDDAHRVLRQARHTTRGDQDPEAHARALFNTGFLSVSRWSPLGAERCAAGLDRLHLRGTTSEADACGDLIRAELAFRGRDWAHLHTIVTRLHGKDIHPTLTAAYAARIAVEAGERVAKEAALERRSPASVRLRLGLLRRRDHGVGLESLSRLVRIARRHATTREAVEWLITHLGSQRGDGDPSVEFGLKALSWFEFREGHDDLQIELRAQLAAMLRARGRSAEAWRLIEDALLRFRRLERRLRRWGRGVHVLLHLQERIQVALRGASAGGTRTGEEMSAALCVQAFDLLMENRQNSGRDSRQTDVLVRLGVALGKGGEQDALIDQILSMALDLTGAQRAVLITGTSKSHEVRRTLFAGGGPSTEARLDISWAIVSQVLTSGESSLFSDALTSEELASHRSIATFKLRSLACVPLRAGGERLGVLYLDHHGIAGLITADMLGFLELLGSLIALMIRMGHAEERALKARVELGETHRHLMRAERNRVAGELAGGLVHDLKNVLAAVSGRSQLLRRVNEDPNVLRTLDAIEKAAGTGVGLLQRLQECSRDHSSQREEAVDLVAAAVEALELLAPRLEKGGVQVEVKGLPGAMVWGTPGEYREMFLNLLVNACDAMPDGGTLSVSFQADPDKRQLEAAVKDTGVGMSAETQARIFEPFFTTKGNQGTGLGLVVVRSVVVRRGGSVVVESSVGSGTCFRVVIPALVSHGRENEKGRLDSKRPQERSLIEEC
ncbi:MAG TPA: ATP-binding protein [Planctomycetota bacterium]|nr:ATP-binding protein [Planctomycetota bacterium]